MRPAAALAAAWLLRSCCLAVEDEVLLFQASTQRRQRPEQPPEQLSALRGDLGGEQDEGQAGEGLLDADGCPVTDPGLAYYGNCSAEGGGALQFHAEEADACDGLREDERLVTFLRHAKPSCLCGDCPLQSLGQEQCAALKAHNKLLIEGPFSEEERAEIVYTSPAVRTMETALRVFGDLKVPFEIDEKIYESVPFFPCRSCAEKMFNATQHLELLEKYNSLYEVEGCWKHWHEDPRRRTELFTQKLLSRPERRIVVVAHFWLLGSWAGDMGMNCMEMGHTVVKGALSDAGEWRRLSEHSCNGRRRRWPWGNFRRVVASEDQEED